MAALTDGDSLSKVGFVSLNFGGRLPVPPRAPWTHCTVLQPTLRGRACAKGQQEGRLVCVCSAVASTCTKRVCTASARGGRRGGPGGAEGVPERQGLYADRALPRKGNSTCGKNPPNAPGTAALDLGQRPFSVVLGPVISAVMRAVSTSLR